MVKITTTRTRQHVKVSPSMSNLSVQQLEKLPWGCQDKIYKKSMSLIKKAFNGTCKKYFFTYENVPACRIPSAEDISKLWTSKPYKTNEKIRTALTEKELERFPGLKQHVPITNHTEPTKKQDQDCDHVRNELALNSYHRMGVNSSITTKTGPGPKFYADGCNACMNAIVTRFDENGNLQIMAMKRPENADSDAGEYQMSAGCLFFGGDGQKVNVDGKEYVVKGSVKYNLAEARNVDEKGKLQGEAKAHAVAAILEKLWTDDQSKKIVEDFDFELLFKGLVDDTSNTRHRWVETSYSIHHITGKEDTTILEHLKDSKVNPKRVNVGDGVWRSIEMNPKGKVYSQIVVEEKDESLEDSIVHKKIFVEHDKSAQVYDPAVEFEFWHGDHSFVAARIYEFISSKYQFVKKGEFGFGISEPIVASDSQKLDSHDEDVSIHNANLLIQRIQKVGKILKKKSFVSK